MTMTDGKTICLPDLRKPTKKNSITPLPESNGPKSSLTEKRDLTVMVDKKVQMDGARF